jgi:transcriptional regulator with XRE-family HTH domain
MKSIQEVSGKLRASVSERAVTQAQLKSDAGISQRTLTNVLSGDEDFKVSTLLAVADRLGLELVLVPKAAAVAIEGGATSDPVVKSRVAVALERLRSLQTKVELSAGGRGRTRTVEPELGGARKPLKSYER